MWLFIQNVILILIIFSVNAQMMVRAPDYGEYHKNADENEEMSDLIIQGKDSMSFDEHNEIYRKAKDISHSKGKVIKSKDGGLEYRRSFVNKVSVEVNGKVVGNLINKLRTGDNSSSASVIPVLQDLEYLVHQYDVAIEFVSLGGVEVTFPFMMNQDKDVKAAAFSVLTAAMQGNPTVQGYVSNLHFLENLLMPLLSSEDFSAPWLFSALSSFLRNMANSQIKFFELKGLHLLADILKQKEVPLKSKLKIINLFSDIAEEIYYDIDPEHLNRTLILKKLFADNILQSNLCETVSEYLAIDSYQILENTVIGMNNLYPFCISQFESETVYHQVKKLMDFYNPIFKRSNLDIDLASDLFENIKSLHMKIQGKRKWEKAEYNDSRIKM